MSGTPTQAEVQSQWKNSVAVLEGLRNYVDGTLAGGGGLWDTLLQSLEGDYTPAGLSTGTARLRATLSGCIDQQRVREFIDPILFEYSRLLSAGNAFRNTSDIFVALYEHFDAGSLTVKSRGITFDTTATTSNVATGGAIVGNGAVSRLTVDQNNYPLEFCNVEKKTFRCRADENTGADEFAELFECLGLTASQDAIGRAATGFGSGEAGRTSIQSQHAGTAQGGSLLRNSSFDSYASGGSPKFVGWTETAGGASITQDTSAYYRSNPDSNRTGGVNGSLKITGGAGTVTLTQLLTDMRSGRIDPNSPYFLRVMVNKSAGTAVGGNFIVRMGSVTVTTSVASLAAGWNEVLVPIGTSCWPRNFNQADFKIQVEWATSTSGYLLVDDLIFTQWDAIDGTYWIIRGNNASPVSWLLDDVLEFTDTGGAPATGKIQWWLFIGGYGYLPSSGSPTFTDP